MRCLSNTGARRLFLDRHALLSAPAGPGRGADLAALIHDLGFVQVDSVNTVARAHDMILFSRRPAYRPRALDPLLERDRVLFEHWTHDASVIPSEFFCHWRLKFARDAVRLRGRWKTWRRDGFEERFNTVLERIAAHGPVTSAEVGAGEERGSGGWWDWHPSKTALEFLWRTGALAVTRREGFRKVYDLTERVLPPEHLNARAEAEETVDWACRAALDRLGLATPGELAAFWDLITPEEARDWVRDGLRRGALEEVQVTLADGRLRRVVMWPGAFDVVPELPAPCGRLRVLSPFDPALRDRKRAEALFGFHYRIEIFVPEARRRYGYYVFPLLEGDRLIGRIDMKRQDGLLSVRALWPEPGVRFGKGRMRRLEAELDRVARFCGASGVRFATGWLRDE